MKRGWHFEVRLIFPLIFMLLSFSMVMSESPCHMALAAGEQTFEPEEAPEGGKVSDPYEQTNRKIFDFNDRLYFYVFKPVTIVYSAYLPPGARDSISRGFHNMVFPSRFVNFVLQGKTDKAAQETARFVINSTLGLAGLFDFAQSEFRLENCETDFGVTLAYWGVGSGSFLMVPLLGPSNPRDLVGFAADSVMDPIFWLPALWWETFSAETGKYLNHTSLHGSEYEELKKASLDPYIAVRDGYIQYREHMIPK
jgi:phospholipid-binding lipoprotein MlaA